MQFICFINFLVLGDCVCFDGFGDTDCAIDLRVPPRFSHTPGDCDFFKRPCRATPVYGGLFLDGQNLTCRVQVVEVSFHVMIVSG